jgi:hypothetical protein
VLWNIFLFENTRMRRLMENGWVLRCELQVKGTAKIAWIYHVVGKRNQRSVINVDLKNSTSTTCTFSKPQNFGPKVHCPNWAHVKKLLGCV